MNHEHRDPRRTPRSAPADVQLMADYGSCLWTDTPGRCTHESFDGDAAELGLSHELTAELREWHGEWEEMAYSDGGFAPGVARAWGLRGWRLALHLQAELDPVVVTYFHGAAGPGMDPDWLRPIRERPLP